MKRRPLALRSRVRRVESGNWELPPSMRMSPGSSSGASSSITASTAGPRLDHDHDLPRPLQRADQLLDRWRADDLLPLGPALDERVDLRGRPVEDGDGEPVALHVQHQVLAHHRQADQADVGACALVAMLVILILVIPIQKASGKGCPSPSSRRLSRGPEMLYPGRRRLALRYISTPAGPGAAPGTGRPARPCSRRR